MDVFVYYVYVTFMTACFITLGFLLFLLVKSWIDEMLEERRWDAHMEQYEAQVRDIKARAALQQERIAREREEIRAEQADTEEMDQAEIQAAIDEVRAEAGGPHPIMAAIEATGIFSE